MAEKSSQEKTHFCKLLLALEKQLIARYSSVMTSGFLTRFLQFFNSIAPSIWDIEDIFIASDGIL